MKRTSGPTTAQLEALCDRVEHWRAHRDGGRSMVPEALWNAAVEVAMNSRRFISTLMDCRSNTVFSFVSRCEINDGVEQFALALAVARDVARDVARE